LYGKFAKLQTRRRKSIQFYFLNNKEEKNIVLLSKHLSGGKAYRFTFKASKLMLVIKLSSIANKILLHLRLRLTPMNFLTYNDIQIKAIKKLLPKFKNQNQLTFVNECIHDCVLNRKDT